MSMAFSCNRMRLSHFNSAWMILYIFLGFNCAMFPNTNLVEIIFPQSLDRFRAVAHGKFFIAARMNSIIERIRFSGMVKREFIRFILISSQISSICGCQTDFSEFIIKPHRVKLFLTNSASSSAKSNEGAVLRTSSIYTQIFIPSLLQNFTRLHITLIEINSAEHKPKTRTVNIKYLIFPSIFQEKSKYFWWFSSMSMW